MFCKFLMHVFLCFYNLYIFSSRINFRLLSDYHKHKINNLQLFKAFDAYMNLGENTISIRFVHV